MRLSALLAAACLLAGTAHAQSRTDTTTANDAGGGQRITAGVASGVMHFGDGGRERALSATVGIALPHGFAISVSPTYAWAQAAPTADATTGRLVSAPTVSGLADIPVGVSYSRSLPGSWAPGIWAGIGAVLPTGDTTTVGGGETSVGLDVSMWAEPGAGFSLSAGAGHSLSNAWASGLGSIAPTTVSLGVAHAVGIATLNAGYSTEVGTMPTGTTHSQNFAAGAKVPLGKEFGFALNGSVGHADGASSWALSASIGTAFADVASVSPANALGQLAQALGSGRSLGSSRSAAAKAAAAARKLAHGKNK